MIPDAKVKLTSMSPAAGCAAKIGPGTLAGILQGLPGFEDPNLLVGIETSDDGAVYQISEDTALIQTLDFFPPMVDDPYVFGQVAAANALSDIYAMGGEPKVALNIVAWPNCVNPKFLGEILRGGADKVKEAGAVLAGGHSIQDDVPKYGLSVTGLVHPDKVYKNCGAEPGDVLVLSKPLGTGIVNTAVKAEMASEEAEAEVIRVMTTLNKKAKEILEKFPVHACTDVTGFGLAGQTSGGLLFAVRPETADKILKKAEEAGVAEDWAIVGEVRAAGGKSQDSRVRDEENGQQENTAGLPLAVRVRLEL